MYLPTVSFHQKYKQGPVPVSSLVSLKNKTFASGSIDSILIWDSQNGKTIHRLTDADFQNSDKGPVKSMDVLPNGNLIHTVDQYIKIWNMNNFEIVKTLKAERSHCLAVISDNYIMLSIYETIKIINLETGEIERDLLDNSEILGKFSQSQLDLKKSLRESNRQPDSVKEQIEPIYSGYNTISTSERMSLKNKENLNIGGEIYSLCMLGDDKVIAGSEDKTIKVWNLKTYKCMKTLRGHNDEVKALTSISNVGFASGSKDGCIKIWDSKRNLLKSIQKAHASNVTCLMDLGEFFASGSFDKSVKLWEKENFNCVAILKHKDKVLSMCDLGNNYFAVGTNDGLIVSWFVSPQMNYETLSILKGNHFGDLNFKFESINVVQSNQPIEVKIKETETTGLLSSKPKNEESCCQCLIL
jgi:WD40 repeat protein